jgi:DNA-binding SARP family transcriptional activator
VQFGLLGELVVTAAGRTLAVGGPRQRALLALLLLNANKTVPAELLVEALWPDRTEDASFSALKVAVSRLRRATSDQRGRGAETIADQTATQERIVTRERGYLIRVEQGELDSIEFEQELSAGRAALARGESALALAQLRTALSHWRGHALGEFRDQGWAKLEALRLEGLRLEALEERVRAELSLGNHDAVVTELESLVAIHPERERLHEHLMVALYRSGRQVEALDAFHRARSHLIEEYGIEPGEELRDLHRAILAQDQALAPGRDRSAAGAGELLGPSEGSPRPLTSRLRVHSEFAFVGRVRERAMLENALADPHGTMQSVLISGEPGIGKTRLVSEFATAAHKRGLAVAGGRCDSGLGLPYQPFVEALDDLLRWVPSDVIERHLQVHGHVLARIAPRLSLGQHDAPAKPVPDSEGAHYRLFVAVGDFLTEFAQHSPFVLVLEDLHWADEPTVLLLKHVLTMPNVGSLTFVGTYRSTELDKRPLGLLLPQLHREFGVRRIDLDGLSDAEVIELVQAHTGEELDPDEQHAASRLRRYTAGNAFFLVQLLQRGGAAELGDTVPPVLDDDGRQLPPSLRETITARIAGLGDRAAEVLSAAAVAGDEFELALLRDLTTLPQQELLPIIEAAIGAQLLLDSEGPSSQLAFVHALVPQVLRSELSVSRRRALHRDVAQAMERLYGADGGQHVSALAYHWRQGCEPPVIAPALRSAQLAAEWALASLAPAEAVRWYADALELHSQQSDPDPAERCELLIKLGGSQREAGEAGFRETLLHAARLAERLGDSDRLIEATLANTRGFTSATGQIDTERVAMLQAALRSIDAADSPERARLLVAQAVELAFCGERETPRKLSEEALAMARRSGDDATLVRVLSMRFFAIWTPDTLSTRLAESAESVEVCERLGDRLSQAQALHWHANACIEACDMGAARRCVVRARELSNQLREPTIMWLSAYNDANLALALGQLEEAEQLSMKALELGQRSGQPDALPVFGAQLANLRFDQGRLGELVPLIEQILSEHAGITGFRALLALARWERHETEQARTAIAYDAERGFTQLSYDVTWLSVVCIYAHVCSRLGDQDAAHTLYAMLAPWRDQVAVSVVAWGCVAHYLGMLATTLEDFEAAGRDLDDAARVHAQMSAPTWSAQTQLELGRMLGARDGPGDRARSRVAAAQALDTARKLGSNRLARDASALLDEVHGVS